MPATGGAAAQVPGSGVPYTYDAVALPAAATIPSDRARNISFTKETASTAAARYRFSMPRPGRTQVVIDNGPGATTSIAINPKNNSLYVGVGYGTDAGNIYSFSLSQIDSAYNSGTPINFLSAGTLFNPTGTGFQSGAGMFFDSNGYLFSGGDGITVFRPDGTISYDQPAGAADDYYDTLTYDPANNEVLKVPDGSSTGTLYNAADFEPAASGQSPAAYGSWRTATTGPAATVPTSGTAGVCRQLHGTPIVTLDGNQSAAALVFGDSRPPQLHDQHGQAGALTLGTSAGASITVVSGTIRSPRRSCWPGAWRSARRAEAPCNSPATSAKPRGYRRAQPQRRRAVDPQRHGQLYRRHDGQRRDAAGDEPHALPEGSSLTISAGGLVLIRCWPRIRGCRTIRGDFATSAHRRSRTGDARLVGGRWFSSIGCVYLPATSISGCAAIHYRFLFLVPVQFLQRSLS